MPPKKVTQTKTRVSDEVFTDEDGKNHLIECSGPGQDGNGCVAWVPVWLPTRLPKNFTERPFLCGYCAFTRVKKLRKEAHGDLKVQESRLSIFFNRMPMNNTDEDKISEYLVWRSKQERMCISRLWNSNRLPEKMHFDDVELTSPAENADCINSFFHSVYLPCDDNSGWFPPRSIDGSAFHYTGPLCSDY